ncbi:MAG: MFS transporter [Deltaproteobacteria bacterium]|nr:MAG: MFS transporter [Deltaproteobacteria bacterium]
MKNQQPPNPSGHSLPLQLAVFLLVSASFTNIYLTQPVLPVLAKEFAANMVHVSFTVSAVLFGITLSNLPFGMLSDRLPIRTLIIVGTSVVAIGGLLAALSTNLPLLIAVRFLQGLFLPALTTCVAAYLARTLSLHRLNVVMGAYVSATVAGGLGGRFLGGWIHPPLHWRWAFVSATGFILAAALLALYWLPKETTVREEAKKTSSYRQLLSNRQLLPLYGCGAGSFALFSSIFNYLPFRLSHTPFALSTEMITLTYSAYVVGIIMGPLAGRCANHFGSGVVISSGVISMALALAALLAPSLIGVLAGLIGLCTGFFAVHAAAVGALNRKLNNSHGRANALYVLFYYTGGWLGITITGLVYRTGNWNALIFTSLLFLLAPLLAGIQEIYGRRTSRLSR